MGHLDRVRRKPKAVRTQHAFFTAVAITGLIAVGWLVSLPAQFEEVDIAVADSEQDEASVFTGMFAGVSNALSEVTDRFEGAQSNGESVVSTSTQDTLNIEALINQPVAVPAPKPPVEAVRIATTSAAKIDNSDE